MCLNPWSGFRGPSKQSMFTQIVSYLTNFEEGEDDAVEEEEEGELEEEGGDSEEIDLVLELSTDLDEEELPARKKKPTIVNKTRKKGESGKRSRKTSLSFMDTLREALEDDIQAKIARVDSRPSR